MARVCVSFQAYCVFTNRTRVIVDRNMGFKLRMSMSCKNHLDYVDLWVGTLSTLGALSALSALGAEWLGALGTLSSLSAGCARVVRVRASETSFIPRSY